jgi:hypothetical protein
VSLSLSMMEERWGSRYLTVDRLIFRLESVTSASLAGVGLAYLEGMQAQASVVDGEEEAIAAEAAMLGEDPAAQVEAYRERQRELNAKRHKLATSTPEGKRGFLDRVHAFAAASVSGVGEAPEAALPLVPGIPGAVLHPVGYAPPMPIEAARLSLAPFVEGTPPMEQIRAAGERNEVLAWAIGDAIVEYLGMIAANLAGGRAAVVAPFRACSRDAGRVGSDSAEVLGGPVGGPTVAP